MKADQIKRGDQLVSAGQVVYTVEQVTEAPLGIVATVRYRDGGPGERLWAPSDQVPLQRPA